MRAYFFGNFYLSSIQQGIQAAHVVHDMFVEYPSGHNDKPDNTANLWTWARDHKTMILLNGGMAIDLERIEETFRSDSNPYAWSAFREEEAALNGAITSVGIVLPERMYAGAAAMRAERWDIDDLSNNGGSLVIWADDGSKRVEQYSRFDAKVIDLMNKCGLAK